MDQVTNGAADRDFGYRREHFGFIAELIHRRTGIALGRGKEDLVYSRLCRRLRQLGLSSFAEYRALLSGPDGETELEYAVNALTTNLTRFFREPHHFVHLRGMLEGSWREMLCHRRRLRIWSAGCSTGEEAYSIALEVARVLPSIGPCDAKILATDIDSRVLDTARRGRYPVAAIGQIPPDLRSGTYLERDHQGFGFVSAVKGLVHFKYLNLVEPWPMKGPFDAVFFRNVAIYFDAPTRASVLTRVIDLIGPGGFLYVGHSESLYGHGPAFEVAGLTVYRRAA